jgi:hypothetical protein
MKKYFLFEPENNIDEYWRILLDMVIDQADYIEFNVLWNDWMMQKEFIQLRKFKVKEYEKRKKLFISNKSVRYKNSPEMKEYLLNKKFSDWRHHYLEDPSLIRKEIEFLSCRSNKGRIVLFISEEERKYLISKGLDIWFELQEVLR